MIQGTIPSSTRHSVSKNIDTINNQISSRRVHNKSKSYVHNLRKIFSINPTDENLSVKQIDFLLEDRFKNITDDTESSVIIKEIQRLEKSDEEITKDMCKLKNFELNRINKEFLIKDYARRFNVTQEKVISALIGEDLTQHEFTNLKKEQNVF